MLRSLCAFFMEVLQSTNYLRGISFAQILWQRVLTVSEAGVDRHTFYQWICLLWRGKSRLRQAKTLSFCLFFFSKCRFLFIFFLYALFLISWVKMRFLVIFKNKLLNKLNKYLKNYRIHLKTRILSESLLWFSRFTLFVWFLLDMNHPIID